MKSYPLYVGGLILAFSALAVTSSSSPSTSGDIICPTDNKEDCYPRIFEPTADFQLIKDGQDLPPGLHVRMNIYTGEKEARLNIPTEEDLALEASSSQEVIVVAQPEDEATDEAIDEYEELEQKILAMREKFPQKPPTYETAGKIKPPPPDDNSGDVASFNSALKILKDFKDNFATTNVDQDLDPALDVLFDLSNDIYFGVEITKDPEVLLTLFALMYSHDENPGSTIRDLVFNFKGLKGAGTPDTASDSPQSVLRRRQAAGILGHATQNNPTALSELSKPGVAWMEYLCTLIEGETDPAPMKSKIKTLSHFLKDAKLRQDFIYTSDKSFANGTRILLSTFLRKGSEWNAVRSVITELLYDNFVDSEMGGEIGLWPLKDVAGDAKHCAIPAHELDDVCWEYHLQNSQETFSEEGKKTIEKLLRALKHGRSMREIKGIHGEL